MTTTTIKSIKPAGGGDYSSLNSWAIARANDLVSTDRIEIAEVYSGGSAITSPLTLQSQNGWNCNSTHYVEIRAATGEEHQGVFNTGKAYLQQTTNSCLSIGRSMYVYLTKMQFRTLDYVSAVVNLGDNYLPVNTYIFNRCIIVRTNNLQNGPGTGAVSITSGYAVYNNDAQFRNCIILDNGSIDYRMGVAFTGGLAYGTFYNCIIACRVGVNNSINFSFYNYSGHGTTENCYLHCGNTCYLSFSGGTIAQGSKDATSTTEATDPSLRSVPYSTATFKSVTVGSEDFHPVVSGTNKLLDHGANLTGQGVTTDIVGVARPQFGTFDIGAFENDIPICWNYTARYRGSNKLFKASGCGSFPKTLRVPSNVDISTGRMIDDGQLIDPNQYKIV